MVYPDPGAERLHEVPARVIMVSHPVRRLNYPFAGHSQARLHHPACHSRGTIGRAAEDNGGALDLAAQLDQPVQLLEAIQVDPMHAGHDRVVGLLEHQAVQPHPGVHLDRPDRRPEHIEWLALLE